MTCNVERQPGSAVSRFVASSSIQKIEPFDMLIEFENDPTTRLDKDVVDETAQFSNAIVHKHELTDYPTLASRIEVGPLNTVEISNFIVEWGYDDEQLRDLTRDIFLTSSGVAEDIIPKENTTTATKEVLEQMDMFFDDNYASSISNGVCAVFKTAAVVFGSIAVIDSAVDKISELKNTTSLDQVLSISAITDALKRTVDTLARRYLGQIKNLVDNAITVVKDLEGTAERMFKTLNKKAHEVEDFFSKENMTSLKDKVESVVARTVAQFEKITPDTIAFIMFKMCQFTQVLDLLMKGPVDAMKEFTDLTVAKFRTIGANQAAASILAVSGGAWRAPTNERKIRRERALANINRRAATGVTRSPHITVPLTEEEMKSVRGITSEGTEDFYFAQSVLNMGTKAREILNSSGIKDHWNPSENGPDAGWKYVAVHHPELYVKLSRIAKRMGVKLLIISAYRSPYYNLVYQRRVLGNTGAARNSYHMSGMALDIALKENGATYSLDHAEFIKAASLEGIGGIGVYNNFIHIDVGPRRTWSSKSLSVQENDYLQVHASDGFRTGRDS